MLTRDSIDDFLSYAVSRGASRATERAYRADLLQARAYRFGPSNETTDWLETENRLADLLNYLRRNQAPKTIQRKLGTFRSWAKWQGIVILSDYVSPTPAPPQPHPIPEGIDGVLGMIQRIRRNPRHRALCALTGLMGLRVDEAVRVIPYDFDLHEMELRVRGKGDKVRIVPVSETAWSHITKAYDLAVENNTTIIRLGNRGARAAITRHAKNAGLSRHVSSHDMRATFATAGYEKTKDLRAVQELLGHADAKTTQAYTGVSRAARRAAAEVA
jgi:site-specific recombinase XerD